MVFKNKAGASFQNGQVYTNSIINPGEWTTVCELGSNITIWEIKVIDGKAYLATSDGVYVLN